MKKKMLIAAVLVVSLVLLGISTCSDVGPEPNIINGTPPPLRILIDKAEEAKEGIYPSNNGLETPENPPYCLEPTDFWVPTVIYNKLNWAIEDAEEALDRNTGIIAAYDALNEALDLFEEFIWPGGEPNPNWDDTP